MAIIVGPPAAATRCKPITDQLRQILNSAADATGIDKVVIASGGQSSNHAPHLKGVVCGWTGSRRHDNGRAADFQLIKNGVALSFTDANGSQVAEFVTACAARGATGIGAGMAYMGPKTIHVGFGTSPSDLQMLVWGASGSSANAPAWLRSAANNGWANPVAESFTAMTSIQTSARSTVMARDGLWLRKGPGLAFDRARLLDEGTALTVLGLDGEWARVDLQGDGRIDGHVLAAFIKSTSVSESGDSDEGLEEPINEEALAELINADE